MAIQFISAAGAATTSVTIPTTKAGDFVVIFAYDGTAITVPTLPAGWTSITTNTGNSNGFRIGYKFAAGGDTSGTWTNATVIIVAIYRGVAGIGTGVASTTSVSGTSTSMSGITLGSLGGSSWVVSAGGSEQITSMSTPAGLTLRQTETAAAGMGILLDSNGGVNSWALHTSTNGTAAVSAGVSFEMRPAFLTLNNYEAAKSTNAGILSMGERIR